MTAIFLSDNNGVLTEGKQLIRYVSALYLQKMQSLIRLFNGCVCNHAPSSVNEVIQTTPLTLRNKLSHL